MSYTYIELYRTFCTEYALMFRNEQCLLNNKCFPQTLPFWHEQCLSKNIDFRFKGMLPLEMQLCICSKGYLNNIFTERDCSCPIKFTPSNNATFQGTLLHLQHYIAPDWIMANCPQGPCFFSPYFILRHFAKYGCLHGWLCFLKWVRTHFLGSNNAHTIWNVSLPKNQFPTNTSFWNGQYFFEKRSFKECYLLHKMRVFLRLYTASFKNILVERTVFVDQIYVFQVTNVRFSK